MKIEGTAHGTILEYLTAASIFCDPKWTSEHDARASYHDIQDYRTRLL